jgi:hypothetical protein
MRGKKKIKLIEKKTSWSNSLPSSGLKLKCMGVVTIWSSWLGNSKDNPDKLRKKKYEAEKKKRKWEKKGWVEKQKFHYYEQ